MPLNIFRDKLAEILRQKAEAQPRDLYSQMMTQRETPNIKIPKLILSKLAERITHSASTTPIPTLKPKIIIPKLELKQPIQKPTQELIQKPALKLPTLKLSGEAAVSTTPTPDSGQVDILKTIKTALGTVRKTIIPNKREILDTLQKEAGTTFGLQDAAKRILEEEKKRGLITPPIRIDNKQDFERFLNLPATDPFGAMGGIKNVAKEGLEQLSKNLVRKVITETEFGVSLRKLFPKINTSIVEEITSKAKALVGSGKKPNIIQKDIEGFISKKLSTPVSPELQSLLNKKQSLETLRIGAIGDERVVNAIKKLDIKINQLQAKPPIKPIKELEPLAQEVKKYKSAEEFVNKNLPKGLKQFSEPITKAEQLRQEFPNADIQVFGSTADFKRAPLAERQARHFLGTTKTKPDLDIIVKDPDISKIILSEKSQVGKTDLRTEYIDFYKKVKSGEWTQDQWSNFQDKLFGYSADDVVFKVGADYYKPTEAGLQYFPANSDFARNLLKSRPIDEVIGQFNKTKSQLTDIYTKAKEVKEVIPSQTAIQKLTKALKESGPIRKEQEALYSTERAKRTAQMVAMGKKVYGEKGYFAQLGQLKGSLPRAKFEAIRSKFSQIEVDSLFDMVEQSKILPFEKISVKGGLAGLFDGKIPTKRELELFSEVFPKELMDEILNKRPFSEKLFGFIGQLINTPRAVMASVDFSAPLRQGIFFIGRPKQFFSSFGNMFKYAFSEKAYIGLEKSIKSRPTYELMRRAKIAFTDMGSALTSREEVIMSNLPEKIPILGGVFRGSNRAYTGFLNKLRADVFDDIVRNTKITGKKLTDVDLEGLGKFINSATGRGNIGQLQKASSILNAAFFSPRLMASRINLLNPYFYATLPPIARKEALKSLFSFAGIAGSILGLAKIGGISVGVDSRNADFGKMKIGNTRYDILGGFQQYIRLAGQLITGEIVSSTTGRTMTLGEGYKPLTRKDIVLRFFENKTSPIASFIVGLMTGTTGIGEDFDIPTETINRFIPMVIQDMYDLSQEKGAEGLLMGIPAIFGVGVQTYGKQELKFGKSPIGEPTAQIKSVAGMAEKIRELVLGQLPLGSSKGFSVEAYFDQLSNLPRKEAANIFNKISEANPELAKKLFDIIKERELGITPKDKDLKSKGVSSGDRVLAVKKELDNLKTKEEKAVLWNDYVRKGIITKEVARQLMVLFKK